MPKISILIENKYRADTLHSYQHTESNIKLNALHIIGPIPSLELNLTNEDIKAVILARFKEKSKGLFVLVIRL